MLHYDELVTIEPEDISDFVMPLEAGIIDGCGNEAFFQFRVMTPKRLLKIMEKENIFFGRSVFIVNAQDMQTNLEKIKKEINKMLLSCCRETWHETILALNVYLEWDYYDPDCGIPDIYKSIHNVKTCFQCNGSGGVSSS